MLLWFKINTNVLCYFNFSIKGKKCFNGRYPQPLSKFQGTTTVRQHISRPFLEMRDLPLNICLQMLQWTITWTGLSFLSVSSPFLNPSTSSKKAAEHKTNLMHHYSLTHKNKVVASTLPECTHTLQFLSNHSLTKLHVSLWSPNNGYSQCFSVNILQWEVSHF